MFIIGEAKQVYLATSSQNIQGCDIEGLCSMKWDDLEQTSDERVRFCLKCQSAVHLVLDRSELENCFDQRFCVALAKGF